MNRPPAERSSSVQEAVLAGLEAMSTAQLTQIAQAGADPGDTERLRQLLKLQQQRALTQSEQAEAVRLVEQEDLITLRKAKAISCASSPRSIFITNFRHETRPVFHVFHDFGAGGHENERRTAPGLVARPIPPFVLMPLPRSRPRAGCSA